jgi:hypothetical protein
MCWCKLVSQCLCSRCGILCCKKRKTLDKLAVFQSNQVPVTVVTEAAPQPVTDLLAFRSTRLLATSNSLQRDSSVSTPSPSTTPEVVANQQQQPLQDQLQANGSDISEVPALLLPGRPIRTLSDGPTARQKLLVVSIWLLAAIFGFLTCFPEKMMAMSGGGGPDKSLQVSTSDPPDDEELNVVASNIELSHCSVKNGVNVMLDYIALVVALVAPLIIGPCIVGVFQVYVL